MDGDVLYSIGDLARRTGLTVKATGSIPTWGSCRRLTAARLATAATTSTPSRAWSWYGRCGIWGWIFRQSGRSQQTANDPRRERYLQLLSLINGWSAAEPLAPALDWFNRALRTRLPE